MRTFRAADGLWEDHRIEDVATPEGYANDPGLVHRFYNERRRQISRVRPNSAHEALADFERRVPGELLVVTQNIDNLHERAGTKALVHMHGELLKARCDHCGQVEVVTGDLSVDSACSRCTMGGLLRPHIVWFGEMPLHLDRIYAALELCAVFIAVGTSGNVFPAAGFCDLASRVGARCIEINTEHTVGSDRFDEVLVGSASEKLAPLLASLA